MATDLIAGIREELNRIKGFKKSVSKKLTAESLGQFKGFEQMDEGKRQKVLDAMREFAAIAVRQLNRLVNNKQTEQ